jgi:hypothetical protein
MISEHSEQHLFSKREDFILTSCTMGGTRKTKRPRRWWCGSEINKRRKVISEDIAVEDEQNPEISVFEEYMKIQDLFNATDWSRFMSFLRRPLPVTFRVNRSLHSEELVKICLDEFQPLLSPDPSEVSCGFVCFTLFFG